MNTLIQNILVFSTVAIAFVFLVKKFMPKKTKTNKGCGTNSNCGCH
ncbi:FeoB-associated Cys-rich membrane protein [Seonamhaeicola algicola]|uniref:FeoB-associated Cys-rich membrane protein n=2 Tax=Seonamhaeicola TaxID=1649495 RepID=A0A5C7B5H4_9FLAO|nr:FeoB-associated Cys-rich membrane protein [Seonamhaeicola algicola]TYA64690.1 FeoB-associated Cys-rich membrane protein [Seonamhaeicola marinus]